MQESEPCQAILELLSTMHRLRGPQGCAWDAEQTPESLLPYLMEEACEAIEAIETGEIGAIIDELGDLLLQIVFQAEIFSERGFFDFADVARAINRKLLHRHPHVFTAKENPPPLSPAEVSQQWDRLKQLERSAHADSVQHPLGVIPGRLPALQRAQKLIARARRKGIPLPVMPAAAAQHRPDCEEELGRQLFALAADAEKLGVDAESALRRTVHRVLAETHSQGSTPVESTVDF